MWHSMTPVRAAHLQLLSSACTDQVLTMLEACQCISSSNNVTAMSDRNDFTTTAEAEAAEAGTAAPTKS